MRGVSPDQLATLRAVRTRLLRRDPTNPDYQQLDLVTRAIDASADLTPAQRATRSLQSKERKRRWNRGYLLKKRKAAREAQHAANVDVAGGKDDSAGHGDEHGDQIREVSIGNAGERKTQEP